MRDLSMIVFVARGIPKGQPRPRAFASKEGKVRVYDPGTAEGWKSAIAVAARCYVPPHPWEGPLGIKLTFRMPRPKAHFLRGKLRDKAPYYYTSKPDFDNLAKAVCDALKIIGMYKDDSQLVRSTVEKLYAGESPGCAVELWKIVPPFFAILIALASCAPMIRLVNQTHAPTPFEHSAEDYR